MANAYARQIIRISNFEFRISPLPSPSPCNSCPAFATFIRKSARAAITSLRRGARSRAAMALSNTTGRCSSRSSFTGKRAAANCSASSSISRTRADAHVSIRPEMTPTLARMVIARERDYKKPLRWFSAAAVFPLREAAERAAARVLPVELRHHRRGVDRRRCGDDRADHRYAARLRPHGGRFRRARQRPRGVAGLPAGEAASTTAGPADFLPIIDKIEREDDDTLAAKLEPFGLTLEEVREFIANPGGHFGKFNALAAELDARGMKPVLPTRSHDRPRARLLYRRRVRGLRPEPDAARHRRRGTL